MNRRLNQNIYAHYNTTTIVKNEVCRVGWRERERERERGRERERERETSLGPDWKAM